MQFTLKNKKIATMGEYFDLVKYLSKNLVVGVELERPIPGSADEIGRVLGAIGNRNGDEEDGLVQYKAASGTEHNVVFCYHDGRRSGGGSGVEIIFCGTSEPMKWIYDRLRKIETKIDEHGCEAYNDGCGNHITLVTLQDRPIPTIVLRNFYNLVAAYSSALYWLGSGDKRTLVREGCRHHADPQDLFRHRPIADNLANVAERSEKYRLLTLYKQRFVAPRALQGNDRPMNGVMLELRNPDGMRVPSAISALMVLYRAMFMKAIDLSLSGLLDIDGDAFEENKLISQKIIGAGMRDTKLTPEQATKVVRQANELIAMLTPHLKAHSPEAIPVLYSMAKSPMSFRTGSWTAIDKALFKPANTMLTENEAALVQMIVSHSIDAGTATAWKKLAARTLNLSSRMVEYMMNNITGKTLRVFVYERTVRSYVMMGE